MESSRKSPKASQRLERDTTAERLASKMVSGPRKERERGRGKKGRREGKKSAGKKRNTKYTARARCSRGKKKGGAKSVTQQPGTREEKQRKGEKGKG